MSKLLRRREVLIDGRDLTWWESFHDVFALEFDFFAGYGGNMNAWIDCMASLDEVDGVTASLFRTTRVFLQIRHFEEFSRTSPHFSHCRGDAR